MESERTSVEIMISIIICARKNDIPDVLKENIASTIGAEYETIVIDNSENTHTIFSAYNEGVRRSKYPYLLFMHDDIGYRTGDWGKKLVSHFDDPKVGAIGIAGTPYLSFITGGWWSNGAGYLHLLQSDNGKSTAELQNYFPENSNAQEVVVLDGVWFCIRKEIFKKICFDEDTFKGFHFYDVDTTLQVFFAGYKLLCVKDILIHHHSRGMLDDQWVKNAFLFHEKWKAKLPLSLKDYALKQQCSMEYRVLNELIDAQLSTGKYKKKEIYGTAIKQLASFKKGLWHHKTPVWLMNLSTKYLKSVLKGE